MHQAYRIKHLSSNEDVRILPTGRDMLTLVLLPLLYERFQGRCCG